MTLYLLLLLVLDATGAQTNKSNGMISRMGSVSRIKNCSCFTTHSNVLAIGVRGSTIAASTKDGRGEIETSFYQRLNSPKHILAPMVAQSDLPFRLMCEQLYNVDLSYTQMLHAYNFVEQNGETFRTSHLDVYPQSSIRGILTGQEDRSSLMVTPSQVNALEGMNDNEVDQSRKRILAAISESKGPNPIEVKPTVVQIAAHDPDVAVKAAMMILERSGSMESGTSPVTAIDLNLGCPQSIARKGRYGSFLHDESPELTYKVLAKLRSELPQEIGVTAKIRLPPTQADADAGKLGNISSLGSSPQTIDDRIHRLIDCGVDLITVHGRTRFENKVAVGPVDWDAVRQCVDSARSYSGDKNYPVFSNGGIEFEEDVKKCFEKTNASGVMSSETLLEMPSVFCTGGGETSGPITAKGLLERQLGYADMYLDYATMFPPLPGSLGTKGGSFNVIRSHLFKMLHRYLEENPDLRSWLGSQELRTIRQARDLLSDLRLRYDKIEDDQLMLKKSWSSDSSWYRRHRRQNVQSQNQSMPSLSLEERKELTKLRIKKMQEERKKRSIKSVRSN